MNSDKKLILETERLILRTLKLEDLEDFYDYRCDPEVAKYQGWDIFNLKQAKKYIEKYTNCVHDIPGEWMQFGIELKSEGKLIGDCAYKIHSSQVNTAEVGASINRKYQKIGIAKEALSAMFSFLFDKMNCHRIIGITDVRNESSIMLMEKLKMRREAHFVKSFFISGNWMDELLYAILKEEWELNNTNKLL